MTHSTGDIAAASHSYRPTLQEGDSGDAVLVLQHTLQKKGFEVTEDGLFGPNTTSAVIAFQQQHDLDADGIVGPHTWDVLDPEPIGS